MPYDRAGPGFHTSTKSMHRTDCSAEHAPTAPPKYTLAPCRCPCLRPCSALLERMQKSPAGPRLQHGTDDQAQATLQYCNNPTTLHMPSFFLPQPVELVHRRPCRRGLPGLAARGEGSPLSYFKLLTMIVKLPSTNFFSTNFDESGLSKAKSSTNWDLCQRFREPEVDKLLHGDARGHSRHRG